jgi:chemotaxis protein methyltransferase WspC
LLLQSAANADTYSLLGVILLAERRRDEAAAILRKALYLNPDHREALEQMLVLCESKGETTLAAALRNRLARLDEEEPE